MSKRISREAREKLLKNGVYPDKNYIKPVSHTILIEETIKNEKLTKENEAIKAELELEEQYQLQMPTTHLDFCDHYVNGDYGIAGDPRQAYIKAFGRKVSRKEAMTFMRKKHIAERIKELYSERQDNNYAMRLHIEEKLLSIADECSRAKFKDRFGNPVSPASMRSVAVNALGKLNEMNGFNKPIEVKDVSEGKTGLNFNLIVPKE